MNKTKTTRQTVFYLLSILIISIATCLTADAQDYETHENINNAVIYDHDPSTRIGDEIFGTVIADFGDTINKGLRCSHGGPVCFQYSNSVIVAFYANTTSHNLDGWSEYAFSSDGGRNWDKYHPFKYSFEAYCKDPKQPVWIEEGLVTSKGTAVLILTRFENNVRVQNSLTRSFDNGTTWSDPVPLSDEVIGYPAAVAVKGDLNFVLFDCANGDHELYVSKDDGETWGKRSTLPLQKDAWYGAMCVMNDGKLLAGAYVSKDESHFYYALSSDDGLTWGEQKKAYVDKKVRDPELAYLDGKYYLHGRSGHSGEGAHRFVLYQSEDGENWKSGAIISSDKGSPDGYSHNCIINKYDEKKPLELMILYSIVYKSPRTSEYVFFVKPGKPN